MDVRQRHHVTVLGPGRDPGGDQADGPALVLAHGFGCDQHMWRHVAPHLAEQRRVVLFDHVGAGRSDLSAWNARRYATLDGYADDVVELCRDLDLGPVVFVGHSVAATMGVLAANRAPDLFAALVLVTPSPCYIDSDGYVGGFSRADIDELLESLDSNYLGWSAAMAPVIMGNPERPELGQELTNSFCATDPTIARAFARATFLSDNRADLAHVAVPTLILQCRDDAIAPPAVGAFVHGQVAGSRLVTLDATGHCPQLSAPQATAEAITAFVAALP